MNEYIVILQIRTLEKDLHKFDIHWWKEAIFGISATKGEKVEVLNIVKMKGGK